MGCRDRIASSVRVKVRVRVQVIVTVMVSLAEIAIDNAQSSLHKGVRISLG